MTLSLYLLVAMLGSAEAAEYVCAGGRGGELAARADGAGKPAGPLHQGQRSALVLFASFADDATWTAVPEWGAQLLDPSLSGSLSHFYDTMSFGALRMRGEVAPRGGDGHPVHSGSGWTRRPGGVRPAGPAGADPRQGLVAGR